MQARFANRTQQYDLMRIGMLGGTFDPVHNTHLDIARTALKEARLDAVLFVVSARPPHKVGGTFATPEQRMAMVRAALDGEECMDASDVEMNRDGPSYTGETLALLAERYRDAELVLILGLDSLADLPNWKDPESIMTHASIVAAPRPGENVDMPDSLNGKYTLLPFPESDVSSTEIRRRVAAGESIGHLVPRGVERLITQEGIYRGEVADTASG